MKEVRYWITEDGKRFGDENEACKYEELLHFQKVKNDIICLDINCGLIDPLYPDEAYFLNLRTEEACTWWKKFTDGAGYTTNGVESPGMYVYNETTFEWELLEGNISRLLDAKKELEEA